MADQRTIYLHASDVRQARLILMGEGVADVYWKALLVACWLKGDPANRARLENEWPNLGDAIALASGDQS